MMKNVIDAIDLRTTSGKKLEIEPPVKAPSKFALFTGALMTIISLYLAYDTFKNYL